MLLRSRIMLTATFCLATSCFGIVAAGEVSAAKPLVLLIGQGPDGHPPATHEYMAGVELLSTWLTNSGKVRVKVTRADGEWAEGPQLIQKADGVFLFVSQGAKWIAEEPRRYQAFAAHAQQGKGLAALHWGIGTKEAKYIAGFTALFGPCHGGPDRKYRFLTTNVRPTDKAHAITRGVTPLRTEAEVYYQLKLPEAQSSLIPLLEAEIDDQWHAISYAWTRPGGGRSFVFSGGHFHNNWKHIQYRRLVTQGILWTVKQEIPNDGLAIDLDDEQLRLPNTAGN